jgi:hypothetical protein
MWHDAVSISALRGVYKEGGGQVGLNNFPPRGIAAAVLAKNVPPAHFLNATTFHILFAGAKRIWPSETKTSPSFACGKIHLP